MLVRGDKMNYKLSKSYMAIFIIWMISSFGALLISFISINYTNINIMLIVKTVTVVLAGLSSVLTIFILMRKLNIISNMLLVIFPIILFYSKFFNLIHKKRRD